MRLRLLAAFALAIAFGAIATESSMAQDPKPRVRPDRFAIIFNMGYAGDHLPAAPADFEKLIKTLKSANFNVVMCKYTPERLEICKKYDVQMFVDLLVAEHHIYKEVDAAKALCEKLKDSKAVYGYHLWSDVIGKTSPGRSRDVENVHKWDPNHIAYVGTYRMHGIGAVKGEDLFGYYDFQWKRGGHWGHLMGAYNIAKANQIGFLRYDDASPGMVGKGNPNRVGYTYGTSIPFGLRGFMHHYAGGQIDRGTLELDDLGKDLAKVNERFAAVGPEVVKLSIPSGVFSTPITKAANNQAIEGEPKVPGGLTPVPKDNWFQIKSGEVVVGASLDEKKRDVLVFASHNPYEGQKVTIAFANDVKGAEHFDRMKKEWRPVTIANREATIGVEDYGVDLLRVLR